VKRQFLKSRHLGQTRVRVSVPTRGGIQVGGVGKGGKGGKLRIPGKKKVCTESSIYFIKKLPSEGKKGFPEFPPKRVEET